jgi:hypothetical protein
MVNKTQLINEFITSNELDVVMVTETWLSGDASDDFILLDSCPSTFSYSSGPRVGRKGGGVAVLHRKEISMASSPVISLSPIIESMLVQLRFSSLIITLVTIYRPPASSVPKFMELFTDLCERVFCYENVIVVGDFNLHDPQLLNPILNTFNMVQHVNEATHEKGGILDVVITQKNSNLVCNVTVMPGLSDHSAIVFNTVTTCNYYSSSESTIQTRQYSRINSEVFSSDLWNYVTIPIMAATSSNAELKHPGTLSTMLDTCSLAVLDSHAPMKSKLIRQRRNVPWYNAEVRSSKQVLRRTERKWLSTRHTVDYSVYVTERRRHANLLEVTKNNFINNKLIECGKNSKQLWHVINSSLHRQSAVQLPDHSTKVNLANDFITFFDEKVRNLVVQFKASPLVSSVSFPVESVLEDFNFVTQIEMERVIMKSPTKSSKSDVLPTWLLKQFWPNVAPVVTELVNSCLKYGLPDNYKHALIVPLIKKRNLDRNVMSNYRPVSQLPFISKVVERIVAAQLMRHMALNKLFDPLQSAYRPSHSCETALLYLQSAITSAMDEGKVLLLVLLDLSAAFDTVNHSRLLAKLNSNGINGPALDWFKCYLTNRSQAVIIDTVISRSISLTTGVPQGSVLGPLLFSVYVADLSSIICKFSCKYVMYADDIQLWITCAPAVFLPALSQLEQCIQHVRSWLVSNELIINDKKTEFIVFGSQVQLKKFTARQLLVGDESIKPCEVVRNLGVLFDSNMKMDKHVVNICGMAFAQLKSISRIRRGIDERTCRLMVDSLVLSRVEYCVALLYGVSDTVLNKIDRLIRAGIRVIERIPKSQDVKSLMHNVLTVKQRIYLRMALIMFVVMQCSMPLYLHALLPLSPTNHSQQHLRSHSKQLLPTVRTRTENGKRSFCIAGARVWNSIPVNIRNINSYSGFRRKMVDLVQELT